VIDYDVHIGAPASVVFEMLTDAELLTEWMAVEAASEPRAGGAFRWVYENGDVVAGQYLELEPPHRLLLAYGWERPASRGIPPGSTRVEITLDDAAGDTVLRLVHVGLPAAQEEAHREGWDYFFGRLANQLASRGPMHTGEVR
jgi:uncharacterized protein YndB with AHSA1/START domain